MAHGRRQSVAFPTRAWAVADALTPSVPSMPRTGAKNQGSGVLPNSPFRYTATFTHWPPATSGGQSNDTCVVGSAVQTRLVRATFVAAKSTGPPATGGSVVSSYARAMAPANAPASAAF